MIAAFSRLSTLLGFVLILAGPLWGAAPRRDELPSWALEASAGKTPVVTIDEPAVVLLDDTRREIVDTGLHRVRTRIVVRILRSDGARHAVASLPYDSRRDRVTEWSAWIRKASGETRKLDPRDTVDLDDTGAGTLQSEARRRVLSAAAGAGPGDLFAWEALVEERSPHHQDLVPLIRGMRVARLVHEVRTPAGWQVRATSLHGGTAVESRPDPRTWRWEARDIPPLFMEPWAGPFGTENTGLGLDLVAPGLALPGDWSGEVRRMMESIDPPAVPDAAIRARAAALAAGPDPLVATLREAQAIGYAAMSLDLRRGGGLRPKPAGEVLARRVGDCKDKVTLARALLAAQGIPSYGVSVRAGPGMHPDAAWPNLFLFDHLVLAVQAPPEIAGPAVMEVPGLGRLLMFDPTDESCPPGELPRTLRGALALVIAPSVTTLTRLPDPPPGHDRREETCEITLAPDGGATIRMTSLRNGAEAWRLRAAKVAFDAGELRKELAASIRADHPTAELVEVELDAPREQSAASLSVIVHDRSWSRRAGPLVIVPPFSLEAPLAVPPEPEAARRTRPIHTRASTTTRSTVFHLPEGLEVDELPSAVRIESDFGIFTLTARIDGRRVMLDRTLEFRQTTQPVEAYARFWSFLAAIARADSAPLVLVREP